MSGPTSSDSGQAPTTGQPQAGTPAPPQAGDKPASQFKSVEEAEAAFQRILKDKQEANNEAAETKRLLKQLQDAQKTDEQKRAERLNELEASSSTFEQERQQWRVERAVMLAAPTAGIDAGLAMRLIDLADVKTNAKGEPTNIPELLTKAIADFHLTPAPPGQSTPASQNQRPSVGASNPPRSQTSTPQLSHEYIAELLTTPEGRERYNNDPAIRQWVRTHPMRRY